MHQQSNRFIIIPHFIDWNIRIDKVCIIYLLLPILFNICKSKKRNMTIRFWSVDWGNIYMFYLFFKLRNFIKRKWPAPLKVTIKLLQTTIKQRRQWINKLHNQKRNPSVREATAKCISITGKDIEKIGSPKSPEGAAITV